MIKKITIELANRDNYQTKGLLFMNLDNNDEKQFRERVIHNVKSLLKDPRVLLTFRLLAVFIAVYLISSRPVLAVEDPDYKSNKKFFKLYFLKRNIQSILTSNVTLPKILLYSLLFTSLIGGFSLAKLGGPLINIELLNYIDRLQNSLRGNYEKIETLNERNDVLTRLAKLTINRLRNFIELFTEEAANKDTTVSDFLLDNDIDPDYWKNL
jgi:hypothetical protein